MATQASLARQHQTCSDVRWRAKWEAFDKDVQERLRLGGLGNPVAWAYAFVGEAAEDLGEIMLDYVQGLCGPLDADGGTTWGDLLVELCELHEASKRPTLAHGKRVAAVSDLQLVVDQAQLAETVAQPAARTPMVGTCCGRIPIIPVPVGRSI